MEIIESIAWIGLGFVPTLLALELISRKGVKGVKHVEDRGPLLEVEAKT